MIEQLETGKVYRDAGDADLPPVDFIIGKIEDEPTVEGEPVMWIAHLQIGPAQGHEAAADPNAFVVSHAPVMYDTVAAFAAEHIGEAEINEPFEEGYRAWREAFDSDEGGVFEIRPAAIYAAFQDMLKLQAGGEGSAH